ncbi:MAG: AAA family ATPase [Bacteroidales bacterium]
MDNSILAVIITGIFAILAAIIGSLISSEKVIFTNLRWRNKLPKGFIFIITGSSGVGKTTLAWALARKFNIVSVFSTDYIREAYRYLIEEYNVKDSKCIFESSFLAYTGLDENQQGADKVINGFKRQSELLSGPLINVINRIRNKRDSAIIEGVNLISSQIFKELPVDPLNKIVLIDLFLNDEKTHMERLRERGEKSSEKLERTDRYISNIRQIREIDSFLKKDSNEIKNTCFNIITIENSSSISDAVNKVDNHIKELKKKYRMK